MRGGLVTAMLTLAPIAALSGAELVDNRFVQATAIVVGTVVAAYLTEIIVRRVLMRLAAKTATDLDDQIIEALRQPIFVSVVCGGLAWAADVVQTQGMPRFLAFASLKSIAIVIWSVAAFRVAAIVLEALAGRERPGMVRPASLPAFIILARVSLIATTLYFAFLAWEIDLTAWLASAGIIGIAVGFAAKDTLANLFAGVFIIADAPYKVGDYIVVDGTMRGKVVRIGMRSTRLLTRDDIEITIPNAIIGSSRVINEAGGPYIEQRVRIRFSVAYGTDVDLVRKVVLETPPGVANVATSPAPQCRLRELGESGLHFELLVWCDDASMRGTMIDHMTTKVYKALLASGIEIPYNKLDVFIKEGNASATRSNGRRAATALPRPPAP